MAHQMRALKRMRYGTRRLRAGDEFTVRPRNHAEVLRMLGNAAYVESSVPKPKAKPAPEPEPVVREDLTALRAEFEALAGSKADARWRKDTLERRIAEAKAVAVESEPVPEPVVDPEPVAAMATEKPADS